MRSFVGADAHLGAKSRALRGCASKLACGRRIGPLKCCEFASDFHKSGQFRRADRVVRPYDAKTKPNTITSIRPRAGVFPFWRVGRCGHRPLRRETENIAFCEAFCRGENETLYNNAHPPPRGGISILEGGSMWASTPTARNGQRGDFSTYTRFSNTGCRGGRLCPPSNIVKSCEVFCRGRCPHRPVKMLRIRIGFP